MQMRQHEIQALGLKAGLSPKQDRIGNMEDEELGKLVAHIESCSSCNKTLVKSRKAYALK